MTNKQIYKALTKTFFFTFFFGLFFYVIHELTFTDVNTTIVQHGKLAIDLLDGKLFHVHRGYFHILNAFRFITGMSYEYSTVLILSVFLTLTTFMIFQILKKMFKDTYSEYTYLFLAGVLSIVSGIYLPFFNESIYCGQGSPNVWHNATFIMLKFFSVVAFYYIVEFFDNKKQKDNPRYWTLLSLMLILTVYVKPTFILVFLPAIAIYILVFQTKNMEYYWKILIIALPSILLLIVQYIIFYGNADGISTTNRSIGFEFLTVWRYRSPNFLISILVVLAFPMSVLILRFKESMRNKYLFISWMMVIIGAIQFAFIAEKNAAGEMELFSYSMNWIGGYLIALSMVFIYSIAEMMKWLKSVDFDDKRERAKVWVVMTLLALHTFSGIIYFIRIIEIKIYLA